MANCLLSVVLDEPDRVYHGGETITGLVRVQTTAEVRCKKLEVSIGWRTHGKGNVAQATTQTIEVFSGEWAANQSYTYPFSLTVVGWPPSYNGHFLNIDRVVDARADVPWAFDPKGSTVFQVVPHTIDSEAVAQANAASPASKVVVAVIVGVVSLVSIGMVISFAMTAPFLLLFFLPLELVVAGFVVFKLLLPKWRLGRVSCEWTSKNVQPGQSVRGTLVIEPKKSIPIDGIEVVVKGIEKCISGSGTNATTHQHTVYEKTVPIASASNLQPLQENKFELSATIPIDAPMSVSLKHNELIWNLITRVKQGNWPDWLHAQPIVVGPNPNEPPTATADGSFIPDASAVSFEEIVRLVNDSIDHPDQRDLIVEASAGIPLQATITLDRRLLYGGEHGMKLERGEVLWWASAPQSDPALPLLVIVDETIANSWKDREETALSGQLEILRYDTRHDRLQVRWTS